MKINKKWCETVKILRAWGHFFVENLQKMNAKMIAFNTFQWFYKNSCSSAICFKISSNHANFNKKVKKWTEIEFSSANLKIFYFEHFFH